MECTRIPTTLRLYQGEFPFFARPYMVGEYTVDRQRRMQLGRAAAKYVYTKSFGRVEMDLNIGYDTFEEKDGGDERVDMLLEWITRLSPAGGNLKKVLHETDMVCWRGLLTKIAVTPFSTNDHWRFLAHREKNVIFLCEESTDQTIQRKENMTMREKIMTYWGHKFEQYVTVDSNDTVPDTTGIVSCKEEFGVVSRSSIAAPNGPPIRLLYGAEIDAVDKDGQLVEMKTQRNALEGGFWKQKSLKWWLQSFLVGIEEIVVGYRDDNGIVFRVEPLRVDSLPRSGQWESSVCLRFLSRVLSAVRDSLTEDGMKCLVAFESRDVILKRLPDNHTDFLSKEFKIHFSL